MTLEGAGEVRAALDKVITSGLAGGTLLAIAQEEGVTFMRPLEPDVAQRFVFNPAAME